MPPSGTTYRTEYIAMPPALIVIFQHRISPSRSYATSADAASVMCPIFMTCMISAFSGTATHTSSDRFTVPVFLNTMVSNATATVEFTLVS